MKRLSSLLIPVILAGLALAACTPTQANNPSVPNTVTNTVGTTVVSFAQIQTIFEQRCNGCHSANPTFTGFNPPAGGRDYTNPATIKADVNKIRRETISSQNMPERNNITQMTADERLLLSEWITQGANLQ